MPPHSEQISEHFRANELLMRYLPRKLAFAVANTGAVLVALYIAFARDLERPYWAMFTVFVIAKPISGAVRSKAIYRLLGTLAGASLSLFLIPPLVHAPVLLSVAMSAWVGVCLYVSLFDRTPRSYAFLLAGYTATIVGLAVVNAPESIFDTAVSRIEEISLGVLCASLAHTLFFPTNIAQELNDRISATLRACARQIAAVLMKPEEASDLRSQQQLATVVTDLHVLYTHVAFETSDVPRAGHLMRMLQDRLAVLLPHLSNVQAALGKLRANGGPRAPINTLLESVSCWARRIAEEEPAADADLNSYCELRDRIAALSADSPDKDLNPWTALLEQTVVTGLGDLAAALEETRRPALAVKDPENRTPEIPTRAAPGKRVLHRDAGLALLSACAAVGATLLGCLVWIEGSWPEGAVAAQFAAIGCSLFATFDNPAKVIKGAIVAIVISLPFGALYQFAILPRIDGFASLALVLAPVLMLFSLMQTYEKLEGAGLVLAIGFAGSLALQGSRYRPDFPSFINSNTAEIVGLLLAVVTNLIFRTIDPVWNAVRISRAGWRSVTHLAHTRQMDIRAWTLQMFDRVGLVTSRLMGAKRVSAPYPQIDGMRDIRVGLNISAIRGTGGDNDDGTPPALNHVLNVVSQTYEAWAQDTAAPTQDSVARSIDAGINDLVAQPPSPQRLRGLVALASLRLDLAPMADPYRPAVPAI